MRPKSDQDSSPGKPAEHSHRRLFQRVIALGLSVVILPGTLPLFFGWMDFAALSLIPGTGAAKIDPIVLWGIMMIACLLGAGVMSGSYFLIFAGAGIAFDLTLDLVIERQETHRAARDRRQAAAIARAVATTTAQPLVPPPTSNDSVVPARVPFTGFPVMMSSRTRPKPPMFDIKHANTSGSATRTQAS